MADTEDPRFSDATTGLPPLEDAWTDQTMLVVVWVGGNGLAKSPLNGEPIPVRFLNVRGLVLPTEEEAAQGAVATWSQIALAVPVEHAMDVAASLASGGLLDTPE